MSEINFYFSLFRRRLGWFLATFLLVTSIAVAIASVLPPVYSSAARLVVESEKIPDELAASTVQTQAVEHLEIIQQRILSRESLLNMASNLSIYGSERPEPDSIVRDLRDRITFVIDNGMTGSRRTPQGATMVNISFRDTDPVMVATVTNELVTRVLAEDVQMRTTVARQTLEFFNQEVSRLAEDLSESGATLLSFQQDNRQFLPDAQTIGTQRVIAIQTELARIDRTVDDLARERDRLVKLHQSVRRTQSEIYSNVQTYESRQLAALRETLAQLPAGDPGASDLQARIAGLERRLGSDDGEDPTSARRTAFHDRVDEIDEKIRAEEEERLMLLDELSTYETNLALAPTKTAQFASLEQDHANLRMLYDQALEAKALAETGDAIEALSKGQRVAVIEQASVPRMPVSPNRKLVAAGGSAVGVFLGLLVVALLELRLGFLRRPNDLTRHLGITPIATLPNLDSFMVEPEPARRPRMARVLLWGALGAGLAGCAAAALHFDLINKAGDIVARLIA